MKKLAVAAFLGFLTVSAQAQTICGSPVVESLVANGNITAGSITVDNDNTNVYVQITTTGDFTLSRADVAVATSLAGLPQTGGQPNLSHFPYHQTFSPKVTSVTFTIPLGSNVAGTTLLIAVHASLDSPTQGHQQAWASPGQLFPCSQACSQGSCGDDHGDAAHLGTNDGGGGGCHGDDRARTAHKVGIRVYDDGHGHQCQCGGGGDDHGDGQGTPLDGEGGSCGGGDDRAHGLMAGPQGGGDNGGGGCGGDDHGDSVHLRINDDGGGDHGGGSDCQAGCGATYFAYVISACGIPPE